jgi:ketosteroid isomerase-like protein
MNKISWLIPCIIVFVSCKSHPENDSTISKKEMFRIVRNCESQFSIGIQKKDSTLLTNIYSDSAQYVQPNREIIRGKVEIGKEWGGFLKIKENPIDLVFEISDVRGNNEIIYETGHGYTLLADSTKWFFNYVNVWRLQKNGTYKLEIDTYSPMNN